MLDILEEEDVDRCECFVHTSLNEVRLRMLAFEGEEAREGQLARPVKSSRFIIPETELLAQ